MKKTMLMLMLVFIGLAACDRENDLSEADAERGLNAAFAGNHDEAAKYICEADLAGLGRDAALAEGISADMSCRKDKNQMHCDVTLSGIEEGEPATLKIAFDVEHNKLCNPKVSVPE